MSAEELFNVTNVNNSLIRQISIGLVLYSLNIWTVIGNIAIIIALLTSNSIKNGELSRSMIILIGNLAISDLLLGLTVLPFSATFSTFENWPFGQVLCDIWLSIDVLCCTASIWGLLAIAVDRYIATNHPIIYRKHKKSPKIGIILSIIAWIVSILISLNAFLIDTLFPNGKNETSLKLIDGNYKCILFYTEYFVIASSLGSFYIPLVLMILLYTKVFLTIKRQSNKFSRKAIPSTSDVDDRLLNGCNNNDTQRTQLKTDTKTKKRDETCQQNVESKITVTVVTILGCFILCWLPFFITYIIRSIDPNVVSPLIMDIFIWLGYFNSSLNPILYGILNKHFYIAFKNILSFKCTKQ